MRPTALTSTSPPSAPPQRQAQRAASPEGEAGGEDHGPVQVLRPHAQKVALHGAPRRFCSGSDVGGASPVCSCFRRSQWSGAKALVKLIRPKKDSGREPEADQNQNQNRDRARSAPDIPLPATPPLLLPHSPGHHSNQSPGVAPAGRGKRPLQERPWTRTRTRSERRSPLLVAVIHYYSKQLFLNT